MSDDGRCGAKSKRSGKPCLRWPMAGKKRCPMHGGKSTGPRTPEGKAKAALSLRTHGYYSKMAPMEVEQDLIDEAPGDASLAEELKLARARVAMLVKAGAGENTIADAINVVRKLAAVENNRTASAPAGAAPAQSFAVDFRVVPLDSTGIAVRLDDEVPPEDEVPEVDEPSDGEPAEDHSTAADADVAPADADEDADDEPGRAAPYCGPCRGPCRCGQQH